MGWINALRRARKELGLQDTYVTINRGEAGIALYKRACELHGNKTANCQAANGVEGPTPRAVEGRSRGPLSPKRAGKVKKSLEKSAKLLDKSSKKMAKSLVNRIKKVASMPETQKAALLGALAVVARVGYKDPRAQEAVARISGMIPNLSGVPPVVSKGLDSFVSFLRGTGESLQKAANTLRTEGIGGAMRAARAAAAERAQAAVLDRGMRLAAGSPQLARAMGVTKGIGGGLEEGPGTIADMFAQKAAAKEAGLGDVGNPMDPQDFEE